MAYRVKWIEENLGITRSTLRNFEKMGVMPQNEDGKYRDYTEDDLKRLWRIRILQGIGYSLNEIKQIVESQDFDFYSSVGKKITDLENEIQDKKHSLGYAKFIKMFGRIPDVPKEFGTIKFEDFQNNAVDNLNMNLVSSNAEDIKNVTDILEPFVSYLISKIPDDYTMIYDNFVELFFADAILKEIAKRDSLGTNNYEVQLLVKMLYDRFTENVSQISKEDFGRLLSSFYVEGDVGVYQQERLGKAECEFIANAIAVFGGYKNYEDTYKNGGEE